MPRTNSYEEFLDDTTIISEEHELEHMIVENVEEAIRDIDDGTREVVLIPYTEAEQKDIRKAVKKDAPLIARYQNSIVRTPAYRTKIPIRRKMLMKPGRNLRRWRTLLKPSQVTTEDVAGNYKLQGLDVGKTNFFAGYTGDAISRTHVIKRLFDELYGKDWMLSPEEIKINIHQDDGPVRIHVANNIGVRTGVSQDAFCYWRGTATEFDMHQYVKTEIVANKRCRLQRPKNTYRADCMRKPKFRDRRICLKYDASKYVLVHARDLVYETERTVPHTRINLLPYSPELLYSRPLRFVTNNARQGLPAGYFTEEYTQRETEVIGSLYFKGGVYDLADGFRERTYGPDRLAWTHGNLQFLKNNMIEQFNGKPSFRYVLPHGDYSTDDIEDVYVDVEDKYSDQVTAYRRGFSEIEPAEPEGYEGDFYGQFNPESASVPPTPPRNDKAPKDVIRKSIRIEPEVEPADDYDENPDRILDKGLLGALTGHSPNPELRVDPEYKGIKHSEHPARKYDGGCGPLHRRVIDEDEEEEEEEEEGHEQQDDNDDDNDSDNNHNNNNNNNNSFDQDNLFDEENLFDEDNNDDNNFNSRKKPQQQRRPKYDKNNFEHDNYRRAQYDEREAQNDILQQEYNRHYNDRRNKENDEDWDTMMQHERDMLKPSPPPKKVSKPLVKNKRPYTSKKESRPKYDKNNFEHDNYRRAQYNERDAQDDILQQEYNRHYNDRRNKENDEDLDTMMQHERDMLKPSPPPKKVNKPLVKNKRPYTSKEESRIAIARYGYAQRQRKINELINLIADPKQHGSGKPSIQHKNVIAPASTRQTRSSKKNNNIQSKKKAPPPEKTIVVANKKTTVANKKTKSPSRKNNSNQKRTSTQRQQYAYRTTRSSARQTRSSTKRKYK